MFRKASLEYIIHSPLHHGEDIQNLVKESPTRIAAFADFRENRTVRKREYGLRKLAEKASCVTIRMVAPKVSLMP